MPANFHFDSVLSSNGLETYVPMFKHHAIRNDVLSSLTPEDLIEVGVTSLGHRMKILKLIDDLCDKRRPHFKSGRSHINNQTPAHLDNFQTIPHNSNVTPHNSAREIALLKQKLEASERQIRKLNESLARLRADFFRKMKECEPLPNPMARITSPTSAAPINSTSSVGFSSNSGSTSGTVSSSQPFIPIGSPSLSNLSLSAGSNSHNLNPHSAGIASSKRTPQDGYFSKQISHSTSHLVSSGNSSLPSPGMFKRANSSSHLYSPNNALPNEPASSSDSGHSTPTGYSTPTGHSVSNSQLNSNVMISQNGVMSIFKKMRCGESDTAAKLVNHFIERYPIKGDPSQWRLAIMYDYIHDDEKKVKSRELLDHEFPLQVSKQLEKQGLQPMFHLKQITPSKPPTGSYI